MIENQNHLLKILLTIATKKKWKKSSKLLVFSKEKISSFTKEEFLFNPTNKRRLIIFIGEKLLGTECKVIYTDGDLHTILITCSKLIIETLEQGVKYVQNQQ